MQHALYNFLHKNKVGVGLHYPIPCHKQKVYSAYNNQKFPIAEELCDTLLSLPMHPWLEAEDVMRIGVLLKEFSRIYRDE